MKKSDKTPAPLSDDALDKAAGGIPPLNPPNPLDSPTQLIPISYESQNVPASEPLPAGTYLPTPSEGSGNPAPPDKP